MKKLLHTTSILCFFTLSIFAQNLSTSNVDFQVNGSLNDFILPAYATVTNMSASPISVMCERTNISLSGSHTTSFCWGTQCYPVSTSVSTFPAVIGAGASENSFVGDLNINNTTGTSVVHFRFYNQNSPVDSTGITITFNVTATGINENNASHLISNPRPNPADKYTSLTYALKSKPEQCKIEVINMLGTKVAQYNFTNKAGLFIIPTENLPTGMYFCALKDNNKIVASQKLIVSHK